MLTYSHVCSAFSSARALSLNVICIFEMTCMSQLGAQHVPVQGITPLNVIGGVASLFQWFSSGGDRGSRMLFAGERGGGRNVPAAKSLK
jgi:hypothetical protein